MSMAFRTKAWSPYLLVLFTVLSAGNGESTEHLVADNSHEKPEFMELVEVQWGAAQEVFESLWNETHQVLSRTETYMTGEFLGRDEATVCKNYHSRCSHWAAQGTTGTQTSPFRG